MNIYVFKSMHFYCYHNDRYKLISLISTALVLILILCPDFCNAFTVVCEPVKLDQTENKEHLKKFTKEFPNFVADWSLFKKGAYLEKGEIVLKENGRIKYATKSSANITFFAISPDFKILTIEIKYGKKDLNRCCEGDGCDFSKEQMGDDHGVVVLDLKKKQVTLFNPERSLETNLVYHENKVLWLQGLCGEATRYCLSY